MDKAEFKERLDKAFTAERLKGLLYKAPRKDGKTRDEVQREQTKKSYKKNPLVNRKANQKYYQKNRDNEEFKAKRRECARKYNQAHKAKMLERNREYYQKNRDKCREKYRQYYQNRKLLEAMRQRVQDQKILLENDEPTRAEEELKRFTPEERRAFDEWERQNKKRIVC